MRELITLPAGLSLARSAEVKVGVRSLPYLADHGFQNVVVLPGSFYIQAALLIHQEIFRQPARKLRNIKFQNAVILFEEDTVIEVKVRESADKTVEYYFFESNADKNSTPYLAKLEIDPSRIAAETNLAGEFSIEEFRRRADSTIEADTFYNKLRQNGNQYGPRFQNLTAVWRSSDEALGSLSVPTDQIGQDYLHLTLLDSISQLLGAFAIEKDQAFMLRSIGRIEIRETNFPQTLWARAIQHSRAEDNGKGCVGDIVVFDESGKDYLKLGGVTFAYLDRADGATEEAADFLDFCVASTFTAEPLEESLKFWGDRFGVPTHVHFAPYNQVIQQLLDGGSAFQRNREGVNAILLSLEDWIDKDGIELKADAEKLERSFGSHSRCVLPNGLEIVHLNQYETDYLYGEIFGDQCYLRHGIHISDGDIVIDIGANIGLFSLFVMSRCRNPRIYAFEPSPVVYELLKANCEAYGTNVQVFQCGVSDRPGSAEFTFYEKSSVFSGFRPDASEDKEAIQAVVRNILNGDAVADNELREASVRELTTERLRRRTFQCRLTSVSDIIRENRLERINLLKIDAEKSELDIMKGIEDQHWPLIDQIVIEVHDRTKQAVDLIERLLAEKGYRFAVEEEKLLVNSGLFNIYATRLGEVKAPTPTTKIDNRLEKNIDEFCGALNSFMTHTMVPLFLCVCPRSPAAASRAELNEALDAAEQKLLSRAGKLANVHSIDSQSILKRYPLREYYDPHSHRLGHVPYTPEGYAAIGTILFRTLANLRSTPLKVIALDCDNVLWQGVCGEDGPLGVRVTEAHRMLQEFVIGQMKRGLLVCLCSKNNEQDAFDVFDQQKEMVLKREHLVSWRINWNQKSDNLKALAAELKLGLDSFLFIDDNPVECAEVRIKCPEVLTLQLPAKDDAIPAFLNSIWGMSRAPSTAEDEKRTQMYQENIQREQFREQTLSLKDFLSGLQLRIELAPPTEDQIGRVSQLTFRTNQFNFTTIRRSENEIRDWLAKPNRKCLVASVSDRFGDYGLVGVLLYETNDEQFTVDTFLLSCRVLGRGVEHQLLSELALKAAREGKKFIELQYRPTEKNSPALKFIESLGVDSGNDHTAALSIKIQTKRLVGLQYEPEKRTPAKSVKQKPAGRQAKWFGNFNRSEVLQKICDELPDINRITKAIESYRYRHKSDDVPVEFAPGDTLETTLSKIWKKVLGKPQIGLNENFFEVGGTSLKAVQVIALVQKQLQRSLSITALFECPTIKLLAAKLKGASEGKMKQTDAAEALVRGRQRRYLRTKRKNVLK